MIIAGFVLFCGGDGGACSARPAFAGRDPCVVPVVFPKSALPLALQNKNGIGNSHAGTISHYTIEQAKATPLFVPSLPEQTAIGTFFRTLDDTITLHKRKLDTLKELKEGYLQQMFPQAGERVPRVRFAGFDGEWVERKLGDIVERVIRKNKDMESERPLL